MKIKTRKIIEKGIKQIDKSKIAAEKQKENIVDIKEKTSEITNKTDETVYEYANNRLSSGIKDVPNYTIAFNKQGKKSFIETKKNAIKVKENVSIEKIRDKVSSVKKKASKVNKIRKNGIGKYIKNKREVKRKINSTLTMKQKITNRIKNTYKGIKTTIKVFVKSIRAIIKATQALVNLLLAGGWVAFLIIILLCLVGALVGSIYGVFFINEKLDNDITMNMVISEINTDISNKVEEIKKNNPNDECIINTNISNWKEILAFYSVSNNNDEGFIFDDKAITEIKRLFWEFNAIEHNIKEENKDNKLRKILYINIKSKSLEEMENKYKLSLSQKEEIKELLDDEFNAMWSEVIGGVASEKGWEFPVRGIYVITQYYSDSHKAWDIASNYGSNIYTISDGKVYLTKGGCIVGDLLCNGKGGNYIIIKHNDDRYYSVYMHLKEIKVQTGSNVTKGDVIGTMGNTGNVLPAPINKNSTNGTHLHFVVYDGVPYQGGVAINPADMYN